MEASANGGKKVFRSLKNRNTESTPSFSSAYQGNLRILAQHSAEVMQNFARGCAQEVKRASRVVENSGVKNYRKTDPEETEQQTLSLPQ